jgi:hypothetical protein
MMPSSIELRPRHSHELAVLKSMRRLQHGICRPGRAMPVAVSTHMQMCWRKSNNRYSIRRRLFQESAILGA